MLNDSFFSWDPFRELSRLQTDLNRAFAGANGPAFNVWTGQDGAVITAELPGFSAESFLRSYEVISYFVVALAEFFDCVLCAAKRVHSKPSPHSLNNRVTFRQRSIKGSSASFADRSPRSIEH